MRLPWQRRVAGRVEVESAVASEPAQHAWRKLPALNAAIDTKPPLTAGSVELADALSRRLRSTGERPRLIHRAGLPDAASAGTVRGLAVASGRSVVSRSPQREQDGEDGAASDSDVAEGVDVSQSQSQRVVARRRSSGLLSASDAAREVVRQHTVEPSPESHGDDVDRLAGGARVEEVTLAATQPGPQRTVIHRRLGSATPRPFGLQAPLTAEETGRSASDATLGLTGEEGLPRHETAPRAVAATVGRLHRSDVTDVRVHRDREAELLATSEHARAVTRGGEIFIPATEGPLDSGPGSGLLAHELTHVIQQRRLGRSVPLEHSPAGRRLEADAAMTERHVRGDLGAPAPQPTAVEQPTAALPAPQPPAGEDREDAATARDIQDEMVASGRAFRMQDGSLVFPGGGRHLPEQRVAPMQSGVAIQRAPEEPSSPDSPAAAPFAVGETAPGSSSWSAPTPAPQSGTAPSPFVNQRAPAPEQRLSESTSSPADLAPVPATQAAAAGAVPTAEEPAPIDLDDLARRVYGQVRTQLRSELLIDRERAGLLTDFR